MSTTNANCFQASFPPCETDVLTYDSEANFPATGELDKIYIAQDTGELFYWDSTSNSYEASSTCADPLIGFTDEDGRNSTLVPCDRITLHRTLHVNNLHSGSVGDDEILVSHADSDQTDTGSITTNHNRAVIAVSGGRSSGNNSVYLSGGSNGVVSGNNSIGGGRNTQHSGADGMTHGVNMTTTGLGSYSFGANGTNSGTRSLNIGLGNDVSGNQTNVFGRDNDVSGNFGGAGGRLVTLSGGASFAWGQDIDSTGDQSATFGNTQVNSGNGSLLGGGDSSTTGQRGITWGSFLQSEADFAVNVGSQNVVGTAGATAGDYTITLGSDIISDTRYGTSIGYALVNSGTEYSFMHGAGISPVNPLVQDQERSHIFGYDSDSPALYIDNNQLTGGAGRVLINGDTTPVTAAGLQALFGTGSVLNIQNLPTSNVGLLAGDVYRNGNNLEIV